MTALLDRQSRDGYIDIVLPFDMNEETFFHFCQINSDLQFERDADGKILIKSPSGLKTGSFNAKVVAKLLTWNETHQLGEVADSSTGFYLPNGAMRAPDASWTSKERLSGFTDEQLEKFPYVCPEFVIEMLSPSDSLKKTKAKMTEYIQNGALLGWLIDRKKKQVFIYRADGSEQHLTSFDEPLSGEQVLPGFELNLSSFK